MCELFGCREADDVSSFPPRVFLLPLFVFGMRCLRLFARRESQDIHRPAPALWMGAPPPSNYLSNPASFFRKKHTLSSTGINSNKHPPIASDAKVARLRFPSSSISPKAYWSSIGEKRKPASLLVIQPDSSNGSILIDAASSLASSVESSRG
jgi:hypothetical protein